MSKARKAEKAYRAQQRVEAQGRMLGFVPHAFVNPKVVPGIPGASRSAEKRLAAQHYNDAMEREARWRAALAERNEAIIKEKAK